MVSSNISDIVEIVETGQTFDLQRTIGFKGFNKQIQHFWFPIPSMYGMFTYSWLIFMVNVGTYTIHG